MRTIVYQSYRTKNVPSWITRCMQTVKEWAASKGFDYEFIDDRMFEYAPEWYRKKADNNVLLVSDLARLEIAREFLTRGYERTIWVDADVLVIDQEKFKVDIEEEYAFCKEVWVEASMLGRVRIYRRVNNAVSVFVQGNNFLDFYIHACKSIIGNAKGEVNGWMVGTSFLTRLYNVMHFPVIDTVGLYSPLVMYDLINKNNNYSKDYARAFGTPIYAANLCGSYQGKTIKGTVMDDDFYNTVIDRHIETKGDIINMHLAE